MKSSELENHIRKRLGDQSHRFNLYHDMSCLMLRYRCVTVGLAINYSI